MIKEYTDLLEKLLTSLALDGSTSDTITLAAMETFACRFDDILSDPEFHEFSGYLQEKVSLFRDSILKIALRQGSDHRSIQERVEDARCNLIAIRLKA
ncbi:hypothetical protein ACFSSA_12305 [Luteolibacter algae]|uniref:Colicin D immunity protein domain-containing protein n=1 Tax=Luteolibacter algae TaxID=454151 RepID=A0ABW5D962_9BACT